MAADIVLSPPPSAREAKEDLNALIQQRRNAALTMQTHWRAKSARQQVSELRDRVATGAHRLGLLSDTRPKPARAPPRGAVSSQMGLLREQLRMRLKTGDLDLVRGVYVLPPSDEGHAALDARLTHGEILRMQPSARWYAVDPDERRALKGSSTARQVAVMGAACLVALCAVLIAVYAAKAGALACVSTGLVAAIVTAFIIAQGSPRLVSLASHRLREHRRTARIHQAPAAGIGAVDDLQLDPHYCESIFEELDWDSDCHVSRIL